MNNFADDTMMIVTAEKELRRVTRDFVEYIETFRINMHKPNTATPTKPSKSVIVHVPAAGNKTGAPLKQPIKLRQLADGTSGTICFVRSCVCLGATINEALNDDEEIDKRTLKATQMFGMLRPNVMASKDTWPDVKKQIFVGMLMPTLLDGAEHWIISDSKRRELNVVHNTMVRSSLRFTSCVTRKYRITCQEMHGKLGLENLDYYLDQRMLGHAGHVERMGNERLPKLMRDSCLVGGI